jgi:hypothetical protein
MKISKEVYIPITIIPTVLILLEAFKLFEDYGVTIYASAATFIVIYLIILLGFRWLRKS